MAETTEGRLFELAEQLQHEAKALQAKATDLYRVAAGIKQLVIDIASSKSTPETNN